jgi:serine/threonine protein kinase
MSQIISGYRYLSNQKILHRDLKPSNILRSGKIWKISDFGFSIKAFTGFVDDVNVGTPMYMPI